MPSIAVRTSLSSYSRKDGLVDIPLYAFSRHWNENSIYHSFKCSE